MTTARSSEPLAITPWATRVLAPNPGPMTLEGTNTWLLAAPTAEDVVVVDPGPDLIGHRRSLSQALAGRRVALVLLTHGHPDHSAGVAAFVQDLGSRVVVRSVAPVPEVHHTTLANHDVIESAALTVTVLSTPGHTADSVSFVVRAQPDGPILGVLTGDTVLGRGTTVVAHPEGRLRDYLDSLQLLASLGPVRVLPGHGPLLPALDAAVRHGLEHRAQRLEQVRAAVAAGSSTAEEVVAAVYRDVDRVLWPAATLSVRAQLAYLRVEG